MPRLYTIKRQRVPVSHESADITTIHRQCDQGALEMSAPAEFRFWSLVEKTSGCWPWHGKPNTYGYGRIRAVGRRYAAHVFSFLMHGGVIPNGLQLDHICRNRMCVNPEHLEPVSLVTNVMRGMSPMSQNARKTHCKRGHLLSRDNVIPRPRGRECRTCRQWYRFKLLHGRPHPDAKLHVNSPT